MLDFIEGYPKGEQKDFFVYYVQPFLVGFPCSCVRVCDCQNPNPKDGIALLSYECPKHNLLPLQSHYCLANQHWFEVD